MDFCESRLSEVTFPPSAALLWSAHSLCVSVTGSPEGLGEQRHNYCPALVHWCLWCCVRDWDRPSLPGKGRWRSRGSAAVLPHRVPEDGSADLQHCRQGMNHPLVSLLQQRYQIYTYWSCPALNIPNIVLKINPVKMHLTLSSDFCNM